MFENRNSIFVVGDFLQSFELAQSTKYPSSVIVPGESRPTRESVERDLLQGVDFVNLWLNEIYCSHKKKMTPKYLTSYICYMFVIL